MREIFYIVVFSECGFKPETGGVLSFFGHFLFKILHPKSLVSSDTMCRLHNSNAAALVDLQ